MLYPHIDPVIFHIAGPFSVRWYGLMYLIGFLGAWGLGCYRAKRSQGEWSVADVDDLLFYVALGVILGGRIGYMLFYHFSEWIHDPLSILRIWEGGMSFHGGLLGVLTSFELYARNKGRTFFQVADFVAPFVPIGLGTGRLGNFINGELWGRVTTVPWGMVFPGAGAAPRHPSQLYEFLLEGVLLFTLLWVYSKKPRPVGAVSGIFLLGYGIFRILVECVREPDAGSTLWLGVLTQGQLLSIPMVALGLYLWRRRV